ncbi:DUF6681 family protein [Vagococcus silagei]|uniref:HIRAN domain-containing protein n=1 Tax=Vagococcus silagei TaxID=2508885 RepID=A0A4S3B0X4_9ENTE|nr:DUF6681 family protein [Vagococcus silagei]THB60422.1 hypothetical protein ESZ54_10660 [Vagococcus silagei]
MKYALFGVLFFPLGLSIFLIIFSISKSNYEILAFSSSLFLIVIALEVLLFESLYTPKTKPIKKEVKEIEKNRPSRPKARKKTVVENSSVRSLESTRFFPSETLPELLHDEFPEPPLPLFDIFNTYVIGSKEERRNQYLEQYIDHLKQDDYFLFAFDGMNDEEICHQLNYVEKIWKLSDELLPWATVKKENVNNPESNILSVYIGDNEKDNFKVGYVPREHCEELNQMLETFDISDVEATVSGGTYRTLNDDGKMIQRRSPYHLELTIRLKRKN